MLIKIIPTLFIGRLQYHPTIILKIIVGKSTVFPFEIANKHLEVYFCLKEK